MKNLLFAIFITIFLGYISALCGSVIPVHNPTEERRATDTCADPSLTVLYVEAYSHQFTLHVLQRRAIFVHQDTVANSDWEIQQEAFRAWKDPQEFTVPFYELASASGTDWNYQISTTGSPPVVSGFPVVGILGYVYATQVCGSVPLMAAAQTTIGDRYFTTDQDEHDMLVAFGWVDHGIIAYVMPVDID